MDKPLGEKCYKVTIASLVTLAIILIIIGIILESAE